ncbi:MAG: hypothetical protein ACLFTE_09595 [Salinivenus sp.]
MPFLYDNLTATVAGLTVILILASLQMRMTKSSVTQTGRKAALNQAESFATWLEDDLGRMGRNREEGEVFSMGSRSDEEASPTGAVLRDFTFYSEDDTGTETTVEYTIEEEDSDEQTLYELTRNGGDGQATRLGYFDVRFLDRDAEVISNPEANEGRIQSVRVQFSVVAPFQNDQTDVGEVHRMVVVPYAPAQG